MTDAGASFSGLITNQTPYNYTNFFLKLGNQLEVRPSQPKSGPMICLYWSQGLAPWHRYRCVVMKGWPSSPSSPRAISSPEWDSRLGRAASYYPSPLTVYITMTSREVAQLAVAHSFWLTLLGITPETSTGKHFFIIESVREMREVLGGRWAMWELFCIGDNI